MSNKCGLCLKVVKTSDEGLQCDFCDAWYHAVCVGIDKEEFNKLLEDNESKWYCKKCDGKLEEFKKQQGNACSCNLEKVLERLSNIEKIVEPLAKIANDYSQLQTKVIKLEADYEKLSKEVALIHKSNDIRDQYSRKNNLIISGVSESEGEDLKKMIVCMGDSVNVKCDGVLAAHRLPHPKVHKDKQIPRDIIVKFAAYEVKDALITCYKGKLKSKEPMTGKNLGLGSQEKIWLKDHLTSKRSYLLRQAKKKVSEKKLAYAWVRRGNVFVKVTEKSPAKLVLDLSDIPDVK